MRARPAGLDFQGITVPVKGFGIPFRLINGRFRFQLWLLGSFEGELGLLYSRLQKLEIMGLGRFTLVYLLLKPLWRGDRHFPTSGFYYTLAADMKNWIHVS